MDWSQWSRDAVTAADAKNDAWRQLFGLQNAKYQWDLESGRIIFESRTGVVEANLCAVGFAFPEQNSFQWAWADRTLPAKIVSPLASVREFGEANDLSLLTSPEIPGGIAQGKECVAIAARILDSEGIFIDSSEGTTFFFALSGFRRQVGSSVA